MPGRVELSAATLRRAAWRGLLVAVALFAFCASAKAADRVVLQLSGPPQFRFAGYFAALWQGFYREAGLNVVIAASSPEVQKNRTPVDPVREVVEGRAQFGIGGTDLLLRASEGLPLVLLAPIFQESAARVYYRAETDFSSPAALWNSRIGRLPASNFLDIELRSALRAEGIDADKLRGRPLEPGQVLGALEEQDIGAAIASAWTLPWQAKERGIALKSFDPADYRVAYYGDGLFTVARYAAAHPDITRRLRDASLKGWAWALKHPQPVAKRLAQALAAQPGAEPRAGFDNLGFALYQAALAEKLSAFPGIPLGYANPTRWRRIEQDLSGLGVIMRPVDLHAFLYEEEEAPRQASDEGGLARLGSIIAVALAAALLLAWRGSRLLVALSRARRREESRRESALARNAGAIVSELSDIADRIAAALDRLLRDSRGSGGQDGRNEPRSAGMGESALDAVERLRAVTRRLAASLEPGRAERQPTDLNAALSAIAAAIRQRLPAGVSCRLSLLPDPWLCEADADAVAKSVLDLAGAAAAEMRKGGQLIVGTRHIVVDEATAKDWPGSAPGEYVRVTVRDSGPGFSAQRLGAILDRKATARPAAAAAAEMARLQGGFARVESAEGVGTAVHLYFRRSREEAAPPSAEPAKAAE